jgi:hypothetical protein
MNVIVRLFSDIQQWYRRLFIEFPVGYGDPVSREVEKFQDELINHKVISTQPPDDRYLIETKQN